MDSLEPLAGAGAGAPDAEEELFVFGYQSKIFRDDEKARWIDSGAHLIPCLGDSSLLVDRYDGRGALDNLKSYEPKPGSGGYGSLSLEDQEIERLCDEERWRDCRDEDEQMLDSPGPPNTSTSSSRHSYAQIGYSYEDDGDNKSRDPRDDPDQENQEHGPAPAPISPTKKSKKAKREKEYEPPPGLYVPVDIQVPKTLNKHTVIEKTAKFIAVHGSQMEIIIKTKQASNPHFSFLNYSDPLNPYYKYLVHSIRTRSYQPITHSHSLGNDGSMDTDDESGDSGGSDDDDDPGYLHPSLFAPKIQSSKTKEFRTTTETTHNSINFKPSSSGNSPYSALVSKIKELGPQQEEEPEIPKEPEAPSIPIPPVDTKLVIEKMARYVVKNGPAFEELALNKGDPRLISFLQPGSPYYQYYIKCKRDYEIEAGGVVVSEGFVQYSTNDKSQTSLSSLVSYGNEPEHEEPEKQPQSHSTSFQVQKSLSGVISNSLGSTSTNSNSSGLAAILNPPPGPKPDHQNAINRMSTLPAQLLEKIEQLRKKGSTTGTEMTPVIPNQNNSTGIPISPSASSLSIYAQQSQVPVVKKNKIEFTFKLSTPGLQNGKPEIPIQTNSNANASPVTEDEELKRKREERKRKAQLFLQTLMKEKQVEDDEPEIKRSKNESEENFPKEGPTASETGPERKKDHEHKSDITRAKKPSIVLINLEEDSRSPVPEPTSTNSNKKRNGIDEDQEESIKSQTKESENDDDEPEDGEISSTKSKSKSKSQSPQPTPRARSRSRSKKRRRSRSRERGNKKSKRKRSSVSPSPSRSTKSSKDKKKKKKSHHRQKRSRSRSSHKKSKRKDKDRNSEGR